MLPLQNAGSDKEIDFFRFALADEVATTLSHVQSCHDDFSAESGAVDVSSARLACGDAVFPSVTFAVRRVQISSSILDPSRRNLKTVSSAKGRVRLPPASGRSPPTKTSSPFGKTPIPTSPS